MPQVMFAMRELSGPLSFLIEMINCCSFCNEPFSLGMLQSLKVQSGPKPARALSGSCCFLCDDQGPTGLILTLKSSLGSIPRLPLPSESAGDGTSPRAEERLPDAPGDPGQYQELFPAWLLFFRLILILVSVRPAPGFCKSGNLFLSYGCSRVSW